MVEEGKILVEETIKSIAMGNIHTIAQQTSAENLKAAPKIFRSDCKIDWRQSGIQIHNFVRGLSPYPAAHTIMEDENGKQSEFKVLKGRFEEGSDSKNGLFRLLTDNRTFLKVALADGYYQLLEIQLAGKKAMDIKEFLRGNSFAGKWELK
jgi:methionyl-tRNA formyltransferase